MFFVSFDFSKSREKTRPFISASYGGAFFGGSVTGGREEQRTYLPACGIKERKKLTQPYTV